MSILYCSHLSIFFSHLSRILICSLGWWCFRLLIFTFTTWYCITEHLGTHQTHYPSETFGVDMQFFTHRSVGYVGRSSDVWAIHVLILGDRILFSCYSNWGAGNFIWYCLLNHSESDVHKYSPYMPTISYYNSI